MDDLKKMVETYKEATSGIAIPDTIYCSAGLAQSMGNIIDTSITDETMLVITGDGYEVMR